MGNCLAGLFRRRKLRRHIVLILIGLDNAGKTKTVNNLAGDGDDDVLPTVGFKAVNLIHKDTPVTIYDLGGGPQFRQIWSQYYSEVHGIIFVIDSSDYSRLEECKEVLEEVLSHERVSGKPILVLANKQDKSGALDDIDVVEKLNIEPLVNKYRCPTLVESYSAQVADAKPRRPKIDPGLEKGYHWLLNYITNRYADINLRVQTDIHAELERRRRMANHVASQTFTEESQTGFANPNFGDASVITVKPAAESIDTTITVESVEGDSSCSKPKLSPLFGASNSSSEASARVELEPKSEFRKLSPIVKDRSGRHRHMDFHMRAQSSPSLKSDIKVKLEKASPAANEDLKVTYLLEEEEDSWCRHADRKSKTALVNVDMSMLHKELVLTDRGRSASSAAGGDGRHRSSPPVGRPASASQLVRRQLELAAPHKRRLSLRYMHRAKTSPERRAVLGGGKAGAALHTGDFGRVQS